jgi:hypothetical protein
MIPPVLQSVLQEILHVEMFDMQRALGKQLEARAVELSRRGVLHSGIALSLIAEDATNSLRSRGHFILGQILRLLAAYHVPMIEEVVSNAVVLLKDKINTEADLIRSIAFNGPKFAQVRDKSILQPIYAQYAQEVQRLTTRLTSEIKVAAATAQSASASNGQTLNFHGPVGLVQAGNGNQATVHQHLDAGLKTEIGAALQLLLQRLDQPENQPIGNRAELKELIVEVKAEAEKPDGNALKLKSALQGIAETTKFIGSLGDAYQVLKPLLGHLGIHMS